MADGQGDLRRVRVAGAVEIPRRRLTAEQHRIAKNGVTEAPFTAGNHHNETRPGVYCCASCDAELFRSEDKFDARTGWPSFRQPISPEAVGRKLDFRMVLPRVETHCAACGSRMGHIFKDGPAPTGLRYSLNGTMLTFRPAD